MRIFFSQSFHPLDDLQMMRVLVLLLVEDTRLVQIVDADLPRAVDDLLVAHDDAHVGDVAVFIAEESKVARQCLLQEIH